MTAIKSNHARVFEQLIEARKVSVIEALMQGVKKRQYHQLVGQIQGLDDALKISEEADYKLNGEDIDGS